jgi:hypothetical protein
MNFFWLLRASRMARHPPSGKRLILIGVVLVIVLGFYGIEQIWGWPEWLTPEGGRRGRLLR